MAKQQTKDYDQYKGARGSRMSFDIDGKFRLKYKLACMTLGKTMCEDIIDSMLITIKKAGV